MHCHCLPGIDDGPATVEDSIALCGALARDGVTTVVATPHQFGPYGRRNSSTRIRAGVQDLNAQLERRGVPIEVLPGADVRIDERLLELLDDSEVMTVAGRGAHLLLELPHEHFLDPAPLFKPLISRGIQPVMTHPERHRGVRRSLGAVESWVDQGALVQVTAGSLLGDFGEGAFGFAWDLVGWGLVHVVASDAHDRRRRPPRMSSAIKALTRQAPLWAVERMCSINPLLMVRGEPVTAGPLLEDR